MKRGLPPIVWPHAKILVLGSLPGDESLRKHEYYGNPRNQFWSIVGRIFNGEIGGEYGDRLAFLKQHGVALWDVIGAADRIGSLDSRIRNEQPNDFAPLFESMPDLHTIVLNGSKAAAAFARHVRPEFATWLTTRRILTMPSTSPVPSRKFLDLDAKTEIWKAILQR